jgi:hypothetical protein
MDFKFKNATVAEKFESVFGVDKKITIPGLFSGMLSDITPEVAQSLIDMKDNQIKPKGAKATAGSTGSSGSTSTTGTGNTDK